MYDLNFLIIVGLQQKMESKRPGTLIQIILETVWYCRLLAKGEGGEPVTDERMERDGEMVCGTPPTTENKLPPCAELKKMKLLNYIQLAPISLIAKKDKIRMIRTSGSLARDSWSLVEIPVVDTPLNAWSCGSKILRSLVSDDCRYFSSAHAAFYYRVHPRVSQCFSNTVLV